MPSTHSSALAVQGSEVIKSINYPLRRPEATYTSARANLATKASATATVLISVFMLQVVLRNESGPEPRNAPWRRIYVRRSASPGGPLVCFSASHAGRDVGGRHLLALAFEPGDFKYRRNAAVTNCQANSNERAGLGSCTPLEYC